MIQMGYSNHRVRSYLFVGPTGVGKTNLAKLYAFYFGGEDNLIRVDMSEFSDVMAVNKFIGSAPGYVGYMDNYTVLSQLKEKPNGILLLDEIDKAHPKVINLLYQMLDEGMIKDARNNVVHLNHNIIIMTSNLGFEGRKVGFQVGDNITSSLREKFSDSLINRIDEYFVFDYLKERDVMDITRFRLDKLRDKYPGFKYSNSLVKEIVKESQYEIYGARRIGKIIDSKLEKVIVDKLLKKECLNISHLLECQETV